MTSCNPTPRCSHQPRACDDQRPLLSFCLFSTMPVSLAQPLGSGLMSTSFISFLVRLVFPPSCGHNRQATLDIRLPMCVLTSIILPPPCLVSKRHPFFPVVSNVDVIMSHYREWVGDETWLSRRVLSCLVGDVYGAIESDFRNKERKSNRDKTSITSIGGGPLSSSPTLSSAVFPLTPNTRVDGLKQSLSS